MSSGITQETHEFDRELVNITSRRVAEVEVTLVAAKYEGDGKHMSAPDLKTDCIFDQNDLTNCN